MSNLYNTLEMPIFNGKIIRNFGVGHPGIDIKGNGSVMVSASGNISDVKSDKNYGEEITILHVINGNLISTRYSHITNITPGLKKGSDIKKGLTLAVIDTKTKHLHYEVLLNDIQVDPIPYLRLTTITI